MKDDFESNLPWYVNGTLDPEERYAMDRYIAEHPEVTSKLEWHRRLALDVRKLWQPAVYEPAGLVRALEMIRTRRPVSTVTWWQRISAKLDALGMTPRVAGIAALFVIVAQAALIGVMQRPGEVDSGHAEYRSTSGNADMGPFIRISFRPETKEFDIRMLLVGLGATYVGGPSQLGDYYVFVPRDHIDQAVKQLKASQHVDTANLVAKVPPLK